MTEDDTSVTIEKSGLYRVTIPASSSRSDNVTEAEPIVMYIGDGGTTEALGTMRDRGWTVEPVNEADIGVDVSNCPAGATPFLPEPDLDAIRGLRELKPIRPGSPLPPIARVYDGLPRMRSPWPTLGSVKKGTRPMKKPDRFRRPFDEDRWNDSQNYRRKVTKRRAKNKAAKKARRRNRK